MMMQYAGIIFDFNGVLFWDSALHEQAWRDFTVQARGYPFTAEEMTHYVLGRPNAFILEYVFGRKLAADEIHRRTQEKEARYRQLCLALGADFKLSPGALDLLDFLVAHDIPHTIATASEQVNVNFFFAHLRLAQWFDPARIVLDDGLLPSKPEPQIYLKAAEKIGLAPEECMVVEDSVSGICAARRAGIGKIYALGPPAKHAELAAVEGVNAVITQLGEIPTELFKRSP